MHGEQSDTINWLAKYNSNGQLRLKLFKLDQLFQSAIDILFKCVKR
jgi:hypothetical protein